MLMKFNVMTKSLPRSGQKTVKEINIHRPFPKNLLY